MSLLSVILLPFTWLYGLITDLRNYLYDRGFLKSIRFEVFTLNVGNLTVGGTGKTPHVEYLIRLLKEAYPIATLSRGYGRRTKGFILADEQATAASIGDEPMQFYRQFSGQIQVTVGEERALAIPHLLYKKPEVQAILLDDAFQHRSINPHLNILLTDYHRLFTQDYPFPSGRLRERRRGAKRADVVIVSKCPVDLNEARQKEIEKEIRRYLHPGVPIFFSAIRYGQPVAFSAGQPQEMSTNIVLVSGIANPSPFVHDTSGRYQVIGNCIYKDHHPYSEKDLGKIAAIFQKAVDGQGTPVSILTTEKDYIKLAAPALATWAKALPFFYLPIEVHFLRNGGMKFDALVLQSVRQHVSRSVRRCGAD